MRVIIKSSSIGSTIFCVGDVACEQAGQLSRSALERMKDEKMLSEIDAIEIIEKYYRHAPLFQEAEKFRYYELENQSKFHKK